MTLDGPPKFSFTPKRLSVLPVVSKQSDNGDIASDQYRITGLITDMEKQICEACGCHDDNHEGCILLRCDAVYPGSYLPTLTWKFITLPTRILRVFLQQKQESSQVCHFISLLIMSRVCCMLNATSTPHALICPSQQRLLNNTN